LIYKLTATFLSAGLIELRSTQGSHLTNLPRRGLSHELPGSQPTDLRIMCMRQLPAQLQRTTMITENRLADSSRTCTFFALAPTSSPVPRNTGQVVPLVNTGRHGEPPAACIKAQHGAVSSTGQLRCPQSTHHVATSPEGVRQN
jgi:hypothetical protein